LCILFPTHCEEGGEVRFGDAEPVAEAMNGELAAVDRPPDRFARKLKPLGNVVDC